jgi:DNA-binding transcriptional MerR regulator
VVTYTAGDVVARTGCTYRQLDYWCRRGYVPGQGEAEGSGNWRRFTDAQLEHVARLVVVANVRRRLLVDAV